MFKYFLTTIQLMCTLSHWIHRILFAQLNLSQIKSWKHFPSSNIKTEAYTLIPSSFIYKVRTTVVNNPSVGAKGWINIQAFILRISVSRTFNIQFFFILNYFQIYTFQYFYLILLCVRIISDFLLGCIDLWLDKTIAVANT